MPAERQITRPTIIKQCSTNNVQNVQKLMSPRHGLVIMETVTH